MFYEMRRKEKLLPVEETEAILASGEYGVLSLNGIYPYGVPVSYVFCEGKIYIHCAMEGQKIVLLQKDNRVCFTVVHHAHTLPEAFDVDYASAIAFGTASFPEGEHKRKALFALCEKYASGHLDKFDAYMDKYAEKTAVLEIAVDRLTGKRSVR